MVTDSESVRPLCGTNERQSSRYTPLIVILVFVLATVMAKWVNGLGLPFPQCWLRKLTGIPCPSCGCTRSLAAWATLDLEQAFRFNPLFFVLCVALIVWSGAWMADKLLRRTFLRDLRARLSQWPWWKIGAALLALNWLYLCLTLPK